MRTKLAEELGLEFPIFAFTHCRDVAAAVSKAGGLVVLGVAGHSLKNLKMELEWIEKEVGDKPYGVDLLLPANFAGRDRGGSAAPRWRHGIPQSHPKSPTDLPSRPPCPPLPPNTSPRPQCHTHPPSNGGRPIDRMCTMPPGARFLLTL